MTSPQTPLPGAPHLVSLFTGIGGLDLGLAQSVPDLRHTLVCEADPYCRSVLVKRFPGAFLSTDVRTLKCSPALHETGPVIMAGGFPCQDISIANPRGRGLDGERSGLWFEYMRLIGECRPDVAVIENSPRLRTKGLTTIVEQLHSIGYAVDATRIRAENVGAPHRRERLFIVAHRGDEVPPAERWARLAPGPELHDVPRWSTDAHPAKWPTVTVKGNHNKAGLSAKSGDGLATAIARQWTTLVKADGDRGAGGRNLRTDVDGGPLNPEWCEAFMGFPRGWTDPAADPVPFPGFPMGRGPDQHAWEPPRTVPPRSMVGRRVRVKALGNAVLPPVARIVGERVAAILNH